MRRNRGGEIKTGGNIFISTGELERKDLLEQAEGFGALLNGPDYENLSVELVTIESADHGKAFPMMAVRSMYWLSEMLQGK